MTSTKTSTTVTAGGQVTIDVSREAPDIEVIRYFDRGGGATFQELLMLNPRVRSVANAVPSATTKRVKHDWKRNTDKGCTVSRTTKSVHVRRAANRWTTTSAT